MTQKAEIQIPVNEMLSFATLWITIDPPFSLNVIL